MLEVQLMVPNEAESLMVSNEAESLMALKMVKSLMVPMKVGNLTTVANDSLSYFEFPLGDALERRKIW